MTLKNRFKKEHKHTKNQRMFIIIEKTIVLNLNQNNFTDKRQTSYDNHTNRILFINMFQTRVNRLNISANLTQLPRKHTKKSSL